MDEKRLSNAASNLVHTSIQDAMSSLKRSKLSTLKEALAYEMEHAKRVSMIRALNGAIKRIEKRTTKTGGGD